MFEYLVCFSISGTQGEDEKYPDKDELRASYEQSLMLCLKVDEDEDSGDVTFENSLDRKTLSERILLS